MNVEKHKVCTKVILVYAYPTRVRLKIIKKLGSEEPRKRKKIKVSYKVYKSETIVETGFIIAVPNITSVNGPSILGFFIPGPHFLGTVETALPKTPSDIIPGISLDVLERNVILNYTCVLSHRIK